jgi:hypothetical protein
MLKVIIWPSHPLVFRAIMKARPAGREVVKQAAADIAAALRRSAVIGMSSMQQHDQDTPQRAAGGRLKGFGEKRELPPPLPQRDLIPEPIQDIAAQITAVADPANTSHDLSARLAHLGQAAAPPGAVG